jgi:hypothetical protein
MWRSRNIFHNRPTSLFPTGPPRTHAVRLNLPTGCPRIRRQPSARPCSAVPCRARARPCARALSCPLFPNRGIFPDCTKSHAPAAPRFAHLAPAPTRSTPLSRHRAPPHPSCIYSPPVLPRRGTSCTLTSHNARVTSYATPSLSTLPGAAK